MSERQKKALRKRLTVLLGRLRALETRDTQPHERPIVEVGILALRENIRTIGHRLAC